MNLLWLLLLASTTPGPSAMARFQEGMALYQAGNCKDALVAFEEAQALKPSTALLVKIAECREKTGNMAGARKAWLAIVADTSAAEHEQARKELVRLNQQLVATRVPEPPVLKPEAPPVVPALVPASAPSRETRTFAVITGLLSGAALMAGLVMTLDQHGDNNNPTGTGSNQENHGPLGILLMIGGGAGTVLALTLAY